MLTANARHNMLDHSLTRRPSVRGANDQSLLALPLHLPSIPNFTGKQRMCKFLALAVPLGRQFLHSALSPSPRLDIVFCFVRIAHPLKLLSSVVLTPNVSQEISDASYAPIPRFVIL